MIKRSGNRLLLNMSTYAALQIVNMLVGLFLPRLYLSVYGSEINGVISTINSFTTYFSYLEAGLGLTLIHSLFKPLAENDIPSINNKLSYSKKQYQKISYIYFILVVIISLIFPFARIANDLSKIEFIFLVFVIGLYGAVDFYSMAKYRVLLTADRKEYVISIAAIIAQLLRFVFVWIVLKFGISVVFVKIVPIFTLFVRTLILRIYIKRKYPSFSFSNKTVQKVEDSKNRWDALLMQISISTAISLPTIVVSQVLGYKEANVFAVYCLVANAVTSIIGALTSGVAPMLGRSIVQGKDIGNTYRVYEFVVTMVISIVFSTMAIMILPFVKLYTNVVDDINYIIPIYAVLFSIWAALHSARTPMTAIMNATGNYRKIRMHNMIGLSLQAVGGFIATLLWGIIGVLVVIIIASLHRNISIAYVNKKEILHNSLIKVIIRQFIIAGLITGSFFLAHGFIQQMVTGVLEWIVWAVVVGLCEIVLCGVVFCAFDYKAVKIIFQKLRRRRK